MFLIANSQSATATTTLYPLVPAVLLLIHQVGFPCRRAILSERTSLSNPHMDIPPFTRESSTALAPAPLTKYKENWLSQSTQKCRSISTERAHISHHINCRLVRKGQQRNSVRQRRGDKRRRCAPEPCGALCCFCILFGHCLFKLPRKGIRSI